MKPDLPEPSAQKTPPFWPTPNLYLTGVFVFLAVLWVFLPTLQNSYILLDDPMFVFTNQQVLSGLNWASLKWAMTASVAANWHPLTLFSHILDCQMFGIQLWGHHLTSVLIHAANAVLMLFALHRLTGATWRSLLVALIFGLHPLRVESVAWIAERKDVLSTFFGLISLIYYTRYVQAKSGKCITLRGNYWLALLFFMFGLMSKPMLVTLPCAFLLLDFWPLERIRLTHFTAQFPMLKSLLWEKIPYFILAAAASTVTYLVQQKMGAMADFLTVADRLKTATVSYALYLGKIFWPTKLAVFYPFQLFYTSTEIILSLGLLVVVSVFAWRTRQRWPFCLTGWLWFLGMLVPVIGLVHVGDQSIADRYTYLPLVGIAVMVVWGYSELARFWRAPIWLAAGLSLLVLLACAGLTRQQIAFWRSDEILFRHTLAVTQNNYLAHYRIASDIKHAGKVSEAISHYQAALKIFPDHAGATAGLGSAYVELGLLDKGMRLCEHALALDPDSIEANQNMGLSLALAGRSREAIPYFKKVLALMPDEYEYCYNLGLALLQIGQPLEALPNFEKSLRLKPKDPATHYQLALGLYRLGRISEAALKFQNALQLDPNFIEANNDFAWLLATQPPAAGGNAAQALLLANRACNLTTNATPNNLDTLAVAYAASGNFAAAITNAQRAIALAQTAKNTQLVAKIKLRLDLFQNHQPYLAPTNPATAKKP
jgi:protein O-mannosyl-transferase